MSEYVSKEELKEFFEGIEITVAGRTRAEAISEVLQAIYNGVMKLPTTDAESVIRCKDCNWFRECNGESQCVLWDYATTNKNAFCFYASRKQTGADYAGFEVFEAERQE